VGGSSLHRPIITESLVTSLPFFRTQSACQKIHLHPRRYTAYQTYVLVNGFNNFQALFPSLNTVISKVVVTGFAPATILGT